MFKLYITIRLSELVIKYIQVICIIYVFTKHFTNVFNKINKVSQIYLTNAISFLLLFIFHFFLRINTGQQQK